MLRCFAFLPSLGHMGEWLNADLREQGCAVWKVELHAVQGCPFEVILQTTCYHFMWECLHMHSSAFRAISLFAIFSSPSHHREDKRAGKKKRKELKGGLGGVGGRREQSLTRPLFTGRASKPASSLKNTMIVIM